MDILILIIALSGWIMAIYYRSKAKVYEKKTTKNIEKWIKKK